MCVTYIVEEMLFRNDIGEDSYIDNVNSVFAYKDDKIHYYNVFPNIDLVYTPKAKSVKEEFIINQFNEIPPEYLGENVYLSIAGEIDYGNNVTIYANGIEQTGSFSTEGRILFKNGNEKVYELAKPYRDRKKLKEYICKL